MVALNTQGKKSVDDFGNRPLPGRYHVAVKAVDEAKADYPDTAIAEFEILSGTVPGQVKKTISLFLGKKEDWQLERIARFAMSVGLIGPNEVKEVNLQDAVGRQLVIEVEDYTNKKEGKTYRQVSRDGVWPIGHEATKDVPLDQQMLAFARGTKPTAAAAPATPAAGPAPAGAGARSGQAWGNL